MTFDTNKSFEPSLEPFSLVFFVNSKTLIRYPKHKTNKREISYQYEDNLKRSFPVLRRDGSVTEDLNHPVMSNFPFYVWVSVVDDVF